MFHFEKFSESNDLDSLQGELERFLEFWLGPHKADFGFSDYELSRTELPHRLKRFYAHAGRWPAAGKKDFVGKYGQVDAFSSVNW